jgi:hypothetical protein
MAGSANENMILALYHGIVYAITFAAVITMFASAIGLAAWLTMMVWRGVVRRLQ